MEPAHTGFVMDHAVPISDAWNASAEVEARTTSVQPVEVTVHGVRVTLTPISLGSDSKSPHPHPHLRAPTAAEQAASQTRLEVEYGHVLKALVAFKFPDTRSIFEHQVVAAAAVTAMLIGAGPHVTQYGACLGYEMGLGKTLIGAATMCAVLHTRKIARQLAQDPLASLVQSSLHRHALALRGSRVLILGPVSAQGAWLKDFSTFLPELTSQVGVAHGSDMESVLLNPEKRIVLATYGTLASFQRKDGGKHFLAAMSDTKAVSAAAASRLRALHTVSNLDLFMAINWVMIIMDESDVLRNETTKRTKAVLRLCNEGTNPECRVLLMSGTPIHDGHDDLVTMSRLIKYSPPLEKQAHDAPAEARAANTVAQRHFRAAAMRVLTLDEVIHLPEMEIVVKGVRMLEPQMALYRVQRCEVADRYEALTLHLSRPNNPTPQLWMLTKKHLTDLYNSAFAKLQRIAIHGRFVKTMEELGENKDEGVADAADAAMDKSPVVSRFTLRAQARAKEMELAKIAAVDITSAEHVSPVLRAMLEEMYASFREGHRVLVQSHWTSVLELAHAAVLRHFPGIQVGVIDGSVNAKGRAAAQEKMQSRELHVLFMSLKTAVGLTLTAATRVIEVGQWPNPAVHSQAQFRVRRIGQTRVTRVTKILATTDTGMQSVMHAVVATQQSRARVVHALVHGTDDDQEASSGYRNLIDVECMRHAGVIMGDTCAAAVPPLLPGMLVARQSMDASRNPAPQGSKRKITTTYEPLVLELVGGVPLEGVTRPTKKPRTELPLVVVEELPVLELPVLELPIVPHYISGVET